MLTRRMKSGCDSWWSNVSSASRRIAATGSRWSTSIVCSARADRRVGALEHRHEQLLLAAEVVVDHPLGGAGALGDLVDARAGVAVLGELAAWPRRGSPRGCARRRGGDPGRRPWPCGIVDVSLAPAARAYNVLVRTLEAGASSTRQRLSRRADRRGHRRLAQPGAARARGVAARPRLRVPAARPRRARRGPRRRRRARAGGARRRPRRPQRHAPVQAARRRPSSTSSPPRRRRSARSTPSCFDGRPAVGHNTDATGFAEAFRARPAGRAHSTASCCSARAARAPRSPTRCSRSARGELTIVDVDGERAAQLADARRRRFGPARARRGPDALRRLLAARRRPRPRDADRHGRPPRARPCRRSCCDPRLWVAEVVYRPLETQLLRDARARGCRTLDGGGMVVLQAAGSFELFTGVAPDRERMLAHFAELTADAAGGVDGGASIATVCLSGTLEEKLAAAAARRLRRRRAVRARPDRLAARARARSATARDELGLEIDLYQPFRDFEAVPGRAARATCAAPSASST